MSAAASFPTRTLKPKAVVGHLLMAAAIGWDVDAVVASRYAIDWLSCEVTWVDGLFGDAPFTRIEALAEAFVLLAGPAYGGHVVSHPEMGTFEMIVGDHGFDRKRTAQAVFDWVSWHEGRLAPFVPLVQDATAMAAALDRLRTERPKFFGSLRHPESLLTGVPRTGAAVIARPLVHASGPAEPAGMLS